MQIDAAELHPEHIRGLSRIEYDKLVELGVFEDERIELLRGQLVAMSPQGEDHSSITARLAQRLIKALDFELYDVRSHSPYAASDDSEPEPDVSVALRRTGNDHPSEVLLLIEVSDSSLRKDRRIKLPIYAEVGVPEYWIVDVQGQTVEVYTQPADGQYQQCVRVDRSATLTPIALPDVTIPIGKLF